MQGRQFYSLFGGKKAYDIYTVCEEMGWRVIIKIDPDKPEHLIIKKYDHRERAFLEVLAKTSAQSCYATYRLF